MMVKQAKKENDNDDDGVNASDAAVNEERAKVYGPE